MASSIFRFLTAGSVDDGKSTLIGRLLFDSKSLFNDQLASLEKASLLKHGLQDQIDFSLLTDGLQEERAQGITIDVAYRYFSTPRRKFIIADSPGHAEFTRNMFTAASTANAIVLLVDAPKVKRKKEILPQTRRHAQIASLLGIQNFILAVNKMDLLKFNKADFFQIARMFEDCANDLGIKNFLPIPLSALQGENIIEKSKKMSWYDGPPLLRALENFLITSAPSDLSFRFPIQLTRGDQAQFLMGRVTSGQVEVGDQVLVYANQKVIKAKSAQRTATIKKISQHKKELKRAQAGQSVLIELDKVEGENRGSLLTSINKTVLRTKKFKATLCWFSEASLRVNQPYILKITTKMTEVIIERILERVDLEGSENQIAETLYMNQIALVEVSCEEFLAIDLYHQHQETGSFILIDKSTNGTCAAGMIRAAI